jgi:cobalt-zinc-cadmium efflux system protein
VEAVHSHGHHHHHGGSGKVLKWSLLATVIFVIVQFAAGMQSGSLALVSDAGHNLTDALALGLAMFGVYNIRAASVHMLGDALGSVAIIVGAIAIRYTGWLAIDPILSILIAALIVWSAIDIIRESLNILLEGLPRGLSLQSVTSAMREVPGVLDVHDVHVWSLGSSAHALSCHALIGDMPPSESDCILKGLNQVLGDKFHIHHTTIQFEHANCELSQTGCQILHHHEH